MISTNDTPKEPERKCGSCKRCWSLRGSSWCLLKAPPTRVEWDDEACDHWQYRGYEISRYY